MKVKSFIINNVDYSIWLPFSIKVTETLDESLDNIIIQLFATPILKPFKPLTKAQLTLTDGINEKTYYMAIAIDKTSEIVSSGKVTHNITLIEETKLLERLQIGGKTVTNPSLRTYKNTSPINIISTQTEIPLRVTTYPFKNSNNEALYSRNFSPTNLGNFYIVGAEDLVILTGTNQSCSIKIYYENELLETFNTLNGFYYNISQIGNYKIIYNINEFLQTGLTTVLEINFFATDQIVEYSRFSFPSADINIPTEWTNPILQGTVIDLSDFLSVIPSSDENSFIIESPDGNQELIFIGAGNITLSQLGIYTFYYRTYASAGGVDNQFVMRFRVMTQEEIDNFTIGKTITQVINNILNTYKTLYQNETPTITLNETQANEFALIESPQFSFTNQMSLWEVFSIVGSYIQAIPRLKDGVLYFDNLGGEKISSLNFDNYVVNENNYSIEQFCTEIVSTVDNLVNYEKDGAMVEPSSNFSTLRTENAQAYLDEGTLLIRTSDEIEQLVDLQVGILSDGTEVGSIFDFTYEYKEYQVLSSYNASYPNAKCFAIYWTQGQKNIQGLTFQKPNILGSAFENYAIQNIICEVTGKDYNWFTSLFNNELALQNLLFKVVYIPRVKSKVKQTKTLVEDLENESQIGYNQNSTLIDTKSYGENMRGVVARLGNIEFVRTYIFESLNRIPKVGEIVFTDTSEYFISNIISEIYPDFIQCQISFSKDFNRISEYVGVKNQLRFSEVAIEQVLDRYVNISDYCIIGDVAPTDGNTVIKRGGIIKIAASFRTDALNIVGKMTGVISGTSNDNVTYTNVILPISVFGFGNSFIFSYSYQDNFSAGDQIINLDVGNDQIQKVQQQIQYGDYYGEANWLKLSYVDSGKFLVSQWSEYIQYGNTIPFLPDGADTSSIYFESQPIQLIKDNRETINVVYQMNFVTNRNSIIIGSDLASHNLLISEQDPNFRCYISPNRIRKLATNIDTTGMTPVTLNNQAITNSVTNTGFNLGEFTAPSNGSAWIIVRDNKLVLAENINIQEGKTISLPNFTFTHII